MTADNTTTADPATEQPRRRVFFGLWPEAAAAAEIVRATKRAVRQSGGRPIAKERLHITVAFLGALTASELESARGAPPIASGAFELALDTVGFFPRSRVLWLAPRVIPNALHRARTEALGGARGARLRARAADLSAARDAREASARSRRKKSTR